MLFSDCIPFIFKPRNKAKRHEKETFYLVFFRVFS